MLIEKEFMNSPNSELAEYAGEYVGSAVATHRERAYTVAYLDLGLGPCRGKAVSHSATTHPGEGI